MIWGLFFFCFFQDACFLSLGSPEYEQKQTNYLTNSLFDSRCPENRQQRAPYILDWDRHHDTYSEALATQRFGALWTDYVFVMEPAGSRNSKLLSCPSPPWVGKSTHCSSS